MNNFYTYIHIRPDTNAVFYVGKGKGNRAYTSRSRNEHWKNVVNKVGNFGVWIIAENLSETVAFDLEKKLIAHYGIDNLTNMTDGGEGVSNPSKETRGKIGKVQLGKNVSFETRIKLSKAGLGKKRSPEACERIRQARLGQKRSPETCERMRQSNIGKTPWNKGKKIGPYKKNK